MLGVSASPTALVGLRPEPLRVSAIRRVSGLKVKHARISAAEIARAKEAAAQAGLCLKALEKRPDGSLKLEFMEPGMPDSGDWWAGSPLYRNVA